MAPAVDQPGGRRDDRRALYNGFGDALATAVELALVPVVFALGGLWLDARLGTGKVLTVTAVVLAFVGLGVRAYYGYAAQMDRVEKELPWKRTR